MLHLAGSPSPAIAQKQFLLCSREKLVIVAAANLQWGLKIQGTGCLPIDFPTIYFYPVKIMCSIRVDGAFG